MVETLGAGSFVAGREETLGNFGEARETSYGSSVEGNAGLVTDSVVFCWLIIIIKIKDNLSLIIIILFWIRKGVFSTIKVWVSCFQRCPRTSPNFEPCPCISEVLEATYEEVAGRNEREQYPL